MPAKKIQGDLNVTGETRTTGPCFLYDDNLILSTDDEDNPTAIVDMMSQFTSRATFNGQVTFNESVDMNDETYVNGSLFVDRIYPNEEGCTISAGQYHNMTYDCDYASAYKLGDFLFVSMRGKVVFSSGFGTEDLAIITVPQSVGLDLSSTARINDKDVLWSGELKLVLLADPEYLGHVQAYLIKESDTTLALRIIQDDQASPQANSSCFMSVDFCVGIRNGEHW